jgi:hypothetical protein
MARETASEFERAAGERGQGLAGEMIAFMGQHKKWWLLPIFMVMLLMGVLAIVGSSAAAPFIYTLF